MCLIAFILLFAVTVYVIVEINKLKEYDENNEKTGGKDKENVVDADFEDVKDVKEDKEKSA